MAFRALLFSKSEESNEALISACAEADIRLEVCQDIFAAIDKGTKQPFSCVLVDWAGQPEAGFLLKRSRESGPNKSLVAIALVDHDPTAAEMRDHNLNFLIHRPVVADDVCDLLKKASEKMQSVDFKEPASSPAAEPRSHEAAPTPRNEPDHSHDQHEHTGSVESSASGEDNADPLESDEPVHRSHNFAHGLRNAFAAMLVLTAALFLWNARDTVLYLARTREGRVKVLRESFSALFYFNSSGAQAVDAASTDAQQDAYFSRGGTSPNPAQAPQIAVVPTEADLSNSPMELRKANDIPLPTPEYERPEPEPVGKRSATIPDSLRGGASIAPPVVVTVNPAQNSPVTMPSIMPVSTQNVNEPVSVSEDSARALLIQKVDPTYPPEAVAQKYQGQVVLQATIGRDGRVEDLKIVRGYFVLGKAAIAAVKQWRFQPYMMNGHPTQTQTTISLKFTFPPS